MTWSIEKNVEYKDVKYTSTIPFNCPKWLNPTVSMPNECPCEDTENCNTLPVMDRGCRE